MRILISSANTGIGTISEGINIFRISMPMKRNWGSYEMLQGRPSVVQPEIIGRMRDAFQGLKESGKLRHGSGTFDYGDWAVWL